MEPHFRFLIRRRAVARQPLQERAGQVHDCAGGIRAHSRAVESGDVQYQPWNDYLIRWFNRALTSFPDQVTKAESERHFAWVTQTVDWESFVYPQALHNPFQGTFTPTARPAGSCDITFDGNNGCANTGNQFARAVRVPERVLAQRSGRGRRRGPAPRSRSCATAASPTRRTTTASSGSGWTRRRARTTGPTSWRRAWPEPVRQDVVPVRRRPRHADAGVVLKDRAPSGLSIYEQVYNASIFSLYLPVANVADVKRAMGAATTCDRSSTTRC